MRAPRRVLVFVALAMVGALVSSPSAQSVFFDPARGMARTADADANGVLTAEEWAAFLAGLGANDAGELDRRRIKARLVDLDADGDERLTTKDLALILFPEEAGAPSRQRRNFLFSLVPALADTDANGEVSPDEGQAFLDRATPATGDDIAEAVVLEWFLQAESLPPSQDRNAFTPGVLLATLDAALDADTNGRLTLSDLEQLRAGLDANGDGELDETELARPSRRRGSAPAAPVSTTSGVGQWEVTEADRLRPPLMPWQRTLDDALALQRATGKPLLICVNMDGEAASESLAFKRYRDPAFVKLVEGFIPLLTSPDRRQPRERDDRGRRLPDARFGHLVNSEHIDIEPLLYERYFAGNRVAPRHVGVGADGEILFDLYLLQDLGVVDAKLREFGVPTSPPPAPETLGEAELLASPDAANREELERRFVASDERTRVRLAGLALSAVRDVQQPELVRLALADPSAAVRRQGIWNIIQNPAHVPLDQLVRAFAIVEPDLELRPTFLASLARLVAEAAGTDRADNAAFYLRVYGTLYEPSANIDVERWRLALALAPEVATDAPTGEDFEGTVAVLEGIEAALRKAPQDVELLVQLAAARMRFARIELATGGNPMFFFEDVIGSCRDVLALAPDEGRALGYHAWASYMLNDTAAAGEMAARALRYLRRDAGSPLVAELLNIIATVRTRELYAAMAAGEAWDPAAIPDVRAAYELLLAHPAGTEAHWRAYLDLLGGLRAYGAQGELVRRAVARFPLSGDMHNYLRFQVLRDEGALALEAVYEQPFLAAARAKDGPAMDWFHGLAVLVAAEQDVKNGDAPAALAAYRRSVDVFQRAVDAAPDFASSAGHYQCLARAGAARLLGARGDYAEAVDSLVAGVRLAPGSTRMPDGFGRSPADVARELGRLLEQNGEADLAVDLERRLVEAGLEFPPTTNSSPDR